MSDASQPNHVQEANYDDSLYTEEYLMSKEYVIHSLQNTSTMIQTILQEKLLGFTFAIEAQKEFLTRVYDIVAELLVEVDGDFNYLIKEQCIFTNCCLFYEKLTEKYPELCDVFLDLNGRDISLYEHLYFNVAISSNRKEKTAKIFSRFLLMIDGPSAEETLIVSHDLLQYEDYVSILHEFEERKKSLCNEYTDLTPEELLTKITSSKVKMREKPMFVAKIGENAYEQFIE